MKLVYRFGSGRAEGSAQMKDVLGGKGANLAEMTRLGVPVPPGFTVSTEVCSVYQRQGGRIPAEVKRAALAALAKVEKLMGRGFGDAENPLLVSVRSGARASMPGMMDTILNLGLNDATVKGLARRADERFAWDSYRRFVSMYGDVVLEIPHERFESRIEARKAERGVRMDLELVADDWQRIVREFQE
ncbi:MAG: PEP/pyruvate-binding domain-containing protein, partial [Betaproteobacteria bacterium]